MAWIRWKVLRSHEEPRWQFGRFGMESECLQRTRRGQGLAETAITPDAHRKHDPPS